MAIFLAASEIAHRSLTSAFSDSEMRRASPKSPFSTAGSGLALYSALRCFYWKLFMAKIRHLVLPALKIPDPNSFGHMTRNRLRGLWWTGLECFWQDLSRSTLTLPALLEEEVGCLHSFAGLPSSHRGMPALHGCVCPGRGCSVANLAGRLFASKCGARGGKTSPLSSWPLAQVS